MINVISIPIFDADETVYRLLKEREIIKRISFEGLDFSNIPEEGFRVNKHFETRQAYELNSVVISHREPKLFYHPKPQDELVLLIKNSENFKDLFFIFGLHKSAEIEKRIKDGILSSKDFVALKAIYNHPRYSFFIICSESFHCEVTGENGTEFPAFHVLEPKSLNFIGINESKVRFKIAS